MKMSSRRPARPIAQLLICLIVLGMWKRDPYAQVVTLWAEDFESGTHPYSFDGSADGEGSFWHETLLPTGGWKGSRGSQISVPAGNEQENTGWFVQGDTVKPSGWTTGDRFVVRFRLKLDATYRFDGQSSFQNKMIEWGPEIGSPVDRVIITLERGHASSYCNGLGGLSTDRGVFGVKSGVVPPCLGATDPMPTDTGAPGSNPDPNSAVVVTYDTWYHIQVVVQTHANGGAFYRFYINNNNEAQPNEEVSGFTRTTNNWNDSISVGGYWTHANNNRTSSWVFDDIEFGTAFDPTWCEAPTVCQNEAPPTMPRFRLRRL